MKKLTIVTTIITLLTTASCNDDILNKVNPNGVTFDTYFNNASELTAGVNSIYAIVQGNQLVTREWFFTHDLRGDEMAAGGGQLEAPRAQLLNGNHDTGNPLVGAQWNGWYRAIHRANVVLEKGTSSKTISDADKKRIMGEAYFLRAWAYYELGTLFGGVPIYTEFVKSPDGAKGRSSLADVYKQAITDATTAAAGLPAAHTGSNLGRATRGAAQMLLARIYLQQGDYANARTALKSIVDSGTYSLVDNYTDLTNEEGEFNKESIFEICFAPSGGAINWGGDGDGTSVQEETVRAQEYSPIHWRNLIPSNKLLADYERVSKGDEKNDPRFDLSFWKVGDKFNNGNSELTDTRVQGNTSKFEGKDQKISWRKYSIIYKSDGGNSFCGINQRIMRYADVLLLLAECENELGNSADAIKLMNQVRARKSVDMPPYPTKNYPCDTKAEVFRAVQHERYIELAAEQTRNFDILRWRKNGKLAAEPITYFQKGKHELLPIPQGEVDNNPKIELPDQNSGY